MTEDDTPPVESLLPYDMWAENALRQVAVRALEHVAREGLPGGHHFYITFRTDFPGVQVPNRLRAQYPDEMTIVLQHQFHALTVDEAVGRFSVGLTFSGVPATLIVPFAALTGFADPEVRFGLRFHVEAPETSDADLAESGATAEGEAEAAPGAAAGSAAEPPAPGEAEIVSLDAFRRRVPPKD
jgi:uncharacterized protein